MRKGTPRLLILCVIFCLVGCNKVVQHDDPFYNDDGGDAFPYGQFPLIKPYYVYQMNSASPWKLILNGGLRVELRNFGSANNEIYVYSYDVEDLEQISVQDGVIMAYSSYVDEQAPQSIRDNYYHWFVIILDDEINMGFHDEEEFQVYLQGLGIQNPDWLTPRQAFRQFSRTGCLPWIPDCE